MAIRAQPSVIGQGSAIVIPGSTLFDDSTSDYLSRTPGSTSNRKTFTRSYWVKLTQPDRDYDVCVFTAAGSDANNRYHSGINGDGKFYKYEKIGSDKLDCTSDSVFRDRSGWYHFVEQTDTTNGEPSHRYRVYVNGSQIDLTFSTSYSQDLDTLTNNTNAMTIGARYDASNDEMCANMCEHYLIDGLAIGPGYFGFTDPITNTWRPRKFTAEGTTVNDGTVFSNGMTAAGSGGWKGGYGPDQSFDGGLTTRARSSAPSNNGLITFTPATPIPYKSSIRAWNGTGDASMYSATWSLNGGTATKVWTTGWQTIATGSGKLKTLSTTRNGDGEYFSAIEIDGVVMVDSTTQNLAYGTNGFYLPLDGTGYSAFQTTGNMVQDQSGNQNNHTSSGSPKFTTDSPSGVSGQVNLSGITTTGYPTNYAGISPLFRNSAQGGTLESICVVRKGGTNAWYNSSASENRFKCNSIDVVLDYTQGGKYYWEMSSAGGGYCQMGLCREERLVDINRSGWGISGPGTGYGYQSDGTWGHNRTSLNTSAIHWETYGDIVGMVIDMDEYKIKAWVNGTKESYEVDFSGKIDFRYRHWWPMIALGHSSSDMNAAQDCNVWTGQEPFNYLPDIDNLKPLCAANLSKGTLIRPDTYFKPVMYTGEDSSNTSGTGNTWGIPVDVGFDPDLVVLKSKTQGYGWYWYDSVRRGNDSQGDPVPGAALECYNYIQSENTSAQVNNYGNGIGLRRNGFNVDVAGQAIGEANQGANNMIAYCWKAGGYSSTFNKDGVGYASASDAGLDAGSISPTGSSVNTKQGFSIIKYQGNGNNVTIAHGLNEAPTLLIQKFVSGGGNWNIWMSALSSTERLTFTDSANDTGYWNSTLPTDTVFSIGSGINDDGVDMIAYLWHDIPGVQKFGRYYGNNEGANGPYIQLGFRPAVVICKGHDFTSNWNILDGTRDTNNLTSNILRFNSASAQSSTTSGTYAICGDITSNGFKIRGGSSTNDINDAGQEFIYLAWAESPFGNFNGAQSNAR